MRGDYRGMGCSSCHIPYSNEGFYEGGDSTIDKAAPGHMLVHSIQGTREAKVTVHDTTYSGVPVETCTTCHDRGKRIGVSFQGLMETPYESPFAADGSGQPALHTKHYIAMSQDIHYQKGMTCQDCHVSLDVHGDGFLAAANLASVQIECADCHGTPDRFPWELPLGFMDEYEMTPAGGAPRGVTATPNPFTAQGTAYPPRDGFLLTARGNPYENVVRVGDEVVVHTAAGKDLALKPLKLLEKTNKLSRDGRVAMLGVTKHLARMECYTCHASWTPQCYGCHVKIDYTRAAECPECDKSEGERFGALKAAMRDGEEIKDLDVDSNDAAEIEAVKAQVAALGKNAAFDWIAAGRRHAEPEHAADRGESGYDLLIPGKVTEQRSYMRWEDPVLGVNGEGRVTPLAPGCQPSFTIIGPDGKPILLNHIFKTLKDSEGGGDEGQLAIDLSPTQPHTMTKHARNCESCHASEKALGYGIDGGRSTRPPDERVFVDLETADREVLSDRARPQLAPIPNLPQDWSRIVTEEGEQLMTIGHHFKLSRPLNNDERAKMTRTGTCAACHQEIPSGSLAVSLLHHVAEYSGQMPRTGSQHEGLLHKIMLLAAWGQVAAAVAVPAVLAGAVWWWRRRRVLK